VSYHVRVGEINYDRPSVTAFNSLNDGYRNLSGAHFWFQVVGSDVGRRYENPFFARKRLLASTINEKCNVRVFLSFSAVKLSKPGGANGACQRPLDVDGRENSRDG
jgi:hypothetical protein